MKKISFVILLFTFAVPASHVIANSSDNQLKTIFALVDKNEDGFLSQGEYLKHYETAIAPSIEKAHADKSKDVLNEMHAKNRKRFVAGPFGVGDKNADGKLTFDEYKAYHLTLMSSGK